MEISKVEVYKKRLNEYYKEIFNDFKQADYIISKIGKTDEKLVDGVYDSAFLRMCIKYEAFTAEAYKKLFGLEKVTYNSPWKYTREIAKLLRVNINKEYELTKQAWNIYNSLKHVNITTKRRSQETEKKLNLNTSRERAKYINKLLLALLKKLDIAI